MKPWMLLFAIVFLGSLITNTAPFSGYRLNDFLPPTSAELEKFDPAPAGVLETESLEAVRCYHFYYSRLKEIDGFDKSGMDLIHVTLTKKVKDIDKTSYKHCLKVNLRKLQFAVLAGKSGYSEDRLPVGTYKVNDLEANSLINNPQSAEHVFCKPLAYTPEIQHHTNFDDSKRAFRFVEAPKSIYDSAGFDDQNHESKSILVIDIKNKKDIEKIEPQWDEMVVTCFIFQYHINVSAALALNTFFPHGPDFLQMDIIAELKIDFHSRSKNKQLTYWNHRNRVNQINFPINSPTDFCDRSKVTVFSGGNLVKNGRDYDPKFQPTILSNMCSCFDDDRNTIENQYVPSIGNPLVSIREFSPDPKLKDCFELKIIKSEIDDDHIDTPGYFWVRLWYNENKCQHLKEGSVHLRPVHSITNKLSLGVGNIVALDTEGVPFGTWFSTKTKSGPVFIFPPSCKEGTPGKRPYCKDPDTKARILTYPRDTEFLHNNAESRQKCKEIRSIRDSPHNRYSHPIMTAILVYLPDEHKCEDPIGNPGNEPCNGFEWILGFQPNDFTHNVRERFQLIAEIRIVRLTTEHGGQIIQWLPPETLVIRSTIYKLKTSDERHVIGFEEVTNPTLKKDINIYSGYYLEVSEHDRRCKVKVAIPAPIKNDFFCCRKFHPAINHPQRIASFDFDNVQIKYSACFMLEAFAGTEPNTMHVKFRQFPNKDFKECDKLFGTEFAFNAYDENGFPTGTPGETFSISQSCKDDDLTSTVTENFETTNYPCFFTGDASKYSVDNVKEGYTPSLFMVKIDQNNKQGGICLVWKYPKAGKKPQQVQFYLEVFIPKLITGESNDIVVALRSQVYDLTKMIFSNDGGCHDVDRTPLADTLPDINPFYESCKKKSSPGKCHVEFYKPETDVYDFYLCRKFHEEIPGNMRRIGFGIEGGNPWTRYKECFTLEAFPSSKPFSLHVKFRQFGPSEMRDKTHCSNLLAAEVAIQAVNQHGFPAGTTIVPDSESFEFYSPNSITSNAYCKGDHDIKTIPVHDREITKNYPCFYVAGSDNYTPKVETPEDVPSIFIYRIDPQKNKGGLCLNWKLIEDGAFFDIKTFKFPETIEIMAEVFIYPDVIFVLRSQLYSFRDTGKQFVHDDKTKPCHDQNHKSSWFVKAKHDHQNLPLKIRKFVEECKKDLSKCPVQLLPGDFNTPPPIVLIPDPTGSIIIPPPKKERHEGQSTKLAVYDGCEETKGCIAPPKSCSGGTESKECIASRNCEMLVTFADNPREDEDVDLEREIIIEVYHPAVYKWMAIGISETDKMGKTYVVECVAEQEVNLYHSFNLEGSSENQRLRGEQSSSKPNSNIRLLFGVREGSNIYCRFAIKKQFFVTAPHAVTRGSIRYDYNLKETPYYLIYGWGGGITMEGDEGNLEKHLACDRRSSSIKMGLGARFSPNSDQRRYLRYHAILNVVAILFFFTVGIFSGRYFKETFVNVKVLWMPLWLFVHAFSMTLGIIFMLLGLIMQIIAHLNYDDWKALAPSNFHSYGSCVVIGLFIVVFFLGFFIKPSKFKERNLLSIIHAMVGNMVYFTCFVILIIADRVTFSGTPCPVKYIVGCWGLTILILQCVLTYHYWWVDWVIGIKSARGFGCFPLGVVYAAEEQPRRLKNRRHGIALNPDPNPADTPLEAPGRKIRLGVFFFVMFMGSMYTSWAIFLISRNWDGNKDCYSPKELFEFIK